MGWRPARTPSTASCITGGHSSWNAGDFFTLTLTPSAVPEPANLALMLAGLGVVATIARRRRA